MAKPAWAAWAVPGVVLAAAYLLWLYQRVFFGKVENPNNQKLLDLSPRELATFLPLIAIAFWIGLYPKPLFQILDQPVTALVEQINHPQVYNARQLPLPEAKPLPTTIAQNTSLGQPSAVPEAGR
jgi:NADH-quinone oxidoreductase subunit M